MPKNNSIKSEKNFEGIVLNPPFWFFSDDHIHDEVKMLPVKHH